MCPELLRPPALVPRASFLRFALRLRFGGESHDETGAAAVQWILERDVAVVRFGHRSDDREPETGGARAVAGAAEEAFEDLVVELGWDAGAVVLDGEDDLAVDPLDGRLDRRARVRV